MDIYLELLIALGGGLPLSIGHPIVGTSDRSCPFYDLVSQGNDMLIYNLDVVV